VQSKEKNPGILSHELITALGMTEGAPPPWLINMQRYGPPPSYPNLRIPGLNAPLPSGAAYGYQPGGWGKPPVDEYGRPLYGDVFGVSSTAEIETIGGPAVDKEYRWGKFEVEEVEFEEEEEEDEEEGDEEGDDIGTDKSVYTRSQEMSGLETPSTLDGIGSVISGMETPATIDLRKRAGIETPDTTVDDHGATKELFQVVKEKKQNSSTAGQLFGSDRAYVLPKNNNDIQLSLNPDELDEIMKDKGKMREAHEQQQQDNVMFKHMNNFSASIVDGAETEEDRTKGKKRKAEQTVVSRKVKEFKF
jgi:splicing factor 3B subunit 2